MDILGWIFFGLIVGAIAKLLYPGNDRMGCLSTIALGILGSVVGGIIAKLIWNPRSPVEPASWGLSIVGALIVLAIVSRTNRRRIR
jgi:uncharacterized membrane protein YeaQ/YmgE (transglycosylase-associated protein family)